MPARNKHAQQYPVCHSAKEFHMTSIRWGVLGTAAIARNSLIPAMKKADQVLQAVGSRSQEKAQAFADELGFATAYGSYDAVLADPDVDAAYLPLPVGLHAQWARKCAEAGKHCLCEKPLCSSEQEAQELADLFQAKDLLLVEASMYRHHPLTKRVKELVDTGRLGDIHAVRSNFFVAIPESDIRWQADLAGGAMGDLGCYCVGISRLIAGTEPERIVALRHDQQGVDAEIAGVLQFPGGMLAYFGCGMRSQFDCSYEIFGSQGRLRVDRGGMVVWPGEAHRIQLWLGDEETEEVTPEADHYQLMVADMAEAVVQKRHPDYPVKDAIANMRVIRQVLEAGKAQEPVNK